MHAFVVLMSGGASMPVHSSTHKDHDERHVFASSLTLCRSVLPGV